MLRNAAPVAPRPTASVVPARAIWRSSTTFVEMGSVGLARATPSIWHARCAADARPQTIRLEVRVDGREPDEAHEHRDHRQAEERQHAPSEPAIAPGVGARPAHHRLPIGMTGT